MASGVINPANSNQAIAIKSITASGSVSNSQFLAGYNAAGAVNPDVQIGKVVVKGAWIASDLVAGITPGDDGYYGSQDANEGLVSGGNAVVSKIASISIAGAVIGTIGNPQDGFGFVAEEIGGLKFGKASPRLSKGAGNDTVDLMFGITGDVRLREYIDGP